MIADATFKQLRSLSAVIRYGTISAAAEHLHLTPPAVGQQLKLLERASACRCSNGGRAALHPTDAARELLAAADRIEDELDGTARALELIRSGKVGSVTLGAVSTAKYFAPRLLADFWHAHPDVDVRLEIGNRAETIAAIADHEIDIAIMGRTPAEMALESSVLGPHPHVIIAAPTHHLASAPSIAQSDLHDERFLVREVGSGTRNMTEALFGRAGIQPHVAMEMASNETIKQAVMAELGIALISAHTVSVELGVGRLVVLDVEQTPIVSNWSRVRRQQDLVAPAARLLWDFLAEHGPEHLIELL